jgi:chromosomal replication initiator protein
LEAKKKTAPQSIVHEIIHLLVENEGVTRLDIVSARRSRHVSYVRHIGMYLARTYTEKTFPQIGFAFGSRDHTTVVYACEKMKKILETDPELKKRCEWYGRRIRDIAGDYVEN